MSLVRLRLVCPADVTETALALLDDERSAAAVVLNRGDARRPVGDVITVDLARESLDQVISRLRAHGCLDRSVLTWDAVDTAVGEPVRQAEQRAPGEAIDAVVWDELAARTEEDSRLTATYLAFMVLATMLAAIGVLTNSVVAVVGAMIVGPDFGPLAATAVALVRRDRRAVVRSLGAIGAGFAAAVVITALAVWLLRSVGVATSSAVIGSDQTEFVYHPGVYSVITALVAGAVGMLALTSGRSATLIGVFVSVTTIPAAGYIAVASVFGLWGEASGSLGQLVVNIIGIQAAALAVLGARARRSRAHGSRTQADVA